MNALAAKVAARFRGFEATMLVVKVAARYKKKTISEKGNPIYLYSERQIARRNADKAKRLEGLRSNIDKLRSQVKKDLKSSDPDQFLTALAVALIDETYERVGNDESADDGHFGVTGWQKNHVSFGKGKATIKYVGKAGVKQQKTVSNKAVVQALRDAYEGCKDDCLFEHDAGRVDASKVNAYLKKFDISAKDLRGFHANREMQERLRAARKGKLSEDKKEREKQLKAEFKKALEETAEAVGHEPSTLKSQYLVPGLEDQYLKDGTVTDKMTKAAAGTTDVPLDEAWIAKMRKDFLVLMKNLPRVHDYATGAELRTAFTVYTTNFNEFFFERLLKSDGSGLTDAARSLLRKIGWDFYVELRDFPLDRPNAYYSEGARFAEFEQKKKAWENRLRTKAQVFWRKLGDLLETRTDKQLTVKVPTKDRVVLEGFQAEIVGYDPDDEFDRKSLERFREGLRIYRHRASQVMPILIKRQLPLVVNFQAGLDEGGRYEGSYITISPTAGSSVDKPQTIAKTMAHEMGHHIFKLMSSSATAFWNNAIHGDNTQLDLGELLDKWPPSIRYALDFVDHMAMKDPVLALQVDVLSWGHGSSKPWQDREDFQAVYDSGERVVNVPKSPISGYGGKNAEEGFCEAIGHLVAYGPMAVLPVIKHWLDIVLPGEIKLASIAQRVAARYAQKR